MGRFNFISIIIVFIGSLSFADVGGMTANYSTEPANQTSAAIASEIQKVTNPDFNIFLAESKMNSTWGLRKYESKGLTIGLEKNFLQSFYVGINYAQYTLNSDENRDDFYGMGGGVFKEKLDLSNIYTGFTPIHVGNEQVSFSVSILLGLSYIKSTDTYYGFSFDINYNNQIGLRLNNNLARNEYDNITSLGLLGYF